MARYAAVPISAKYPDGRKPLSPERETLRDAEEQAYADFLVANPLVLQNWKAEMYKSDVDISRQLEDIYDGLDEAAQGRVPQITQDRITAKKTLRGQKP